MEVSASHYARIMWEERIKRPPPLFEQTALHVHISLPFLFVNSNHGSDDSTWITVPLLTLIKHRRSGYSSLWSRRGDMMITVAGSEPKRQILSFFFLRSLIWSSSPPAVFSPSNFLLLFSFGSHADDDVDAILVVSGRLETASSWSDRIRFVRVTLNYRKWRGENYYHEDEMMRRRREDKLIPDGDQDTVGTTSAPRLEFITTRVMAYLSSASPLSLFLEHFFQLDHRTWKEKRRPVQSACHYDIKWDGGEKGSFSCSRYSVITFSTLNDQSRFQALSPSPPLLFLLLLLFSFDQKKIKFCMQLGGWYHDEDDHQVEKVDFLFATRSWFVSPSGELTLILRLFLLLLLSFGAEIQFLDFIFFSSSFSKLLFLSRTQIAQELSTCIEFIIYSFIIQRVDSVNERVIHSCILILFSQ